MSAKKIYKVWIEQTFNAIDIEDSGKWYLPDKVLKRKHTITGNPKLLLADNVSSAISEYKRRFNWNFTNHCIDHYYDFHVFPRVDRKNPKFGCVVNAELTMDFSFNELKKELRANEFMEYCKQELYPIEVILADTK